VTGRLWTLQAERNDSNSDKNDCHNEWERSLPEAMTNEPPARAITNTEISRKNETVIRFGHATSNHV